MGIFFYEFAPGRRCKWIASFYAFPCIDFIRFQEDLHPFVEEVLPFVKDFAFTWFNLQVGPLSFHSLGSLIDA